MNICELFYSIQGESTFAGLPCIFIRLSQCNLQCSYCDTSYANEVGKEMSLKDILNAVGKFPCKLVEITGGEPLLQKEVVKLMTLLCERKYTVLIETNGSLDLAVIPDNVTIIMDLKCPSSGMSDKNIYSNLDHLKQGDNLKFVIADRNDFNWALSVVDKYKLTAQKFTVLMSPVLSLLKPSELAQWILECQKPIRLQLQLHKLIWNSEERGR